MDLNAVYEEAIQAASDAANKWLSEAKPRFEVYSADLAGNRLGPSSYLLDNCGGAYIYFKDKRKRAFKQFKAAGFLKKTFSETLSLHYTGWQRQEHGLHVAACRAALQVFTNHGIQGLALRDYID
jgi:hypothetical protein